MVLISVALSVGVAEVALRILGVAYPIFHKLESYRGWAPQPGATGLWITEGKAHIAINAEGFRDRDHALEKPSGTFRIAVLGDSMSEAFAVPVESTYWSVMVREMAQCQSLKGRKVEALNFSVSGYGTAQALLTLRRNALKYAPDIVLAPIFTGNDILNNDRDLDGHKDRVFFTEKNGALALDDSNTRTTRFKVKAVWRNIRNNVTNASRILQLVREFYYRTKTSRKAAAAPPGDPIFDPVGREYQIFREPSDPAWRRAWSTTEALLRAMRDDSQKAGAAFWVATLTAPAQVFPDAQVREAFQSALKVDTLDYPDRRIAAFAAAEGIPVVTMLDSMRRQADKTNVFFHGFPNTRLGTGHWNENGHRAAGGILARALCDAL
ncbi:MAG: hypothetical protein ACJAU6_001291 [Alphaproteobacteria bacterium]|jgi:hypothetical protein